MVVVIVIFIVGFIFFIFYLKNRLEKNYLEKLIKDYSRRITVLLGHAVTLDSIKPDERKILLEFPKEDFSEWNRLIFKAKKLSCKYEQAIDEYFNPKYPIGKQNTDISNKIESLSFKEVSLFVREDWEKRIETIRKVDNFREQCKDGIKLYCDSRSYSDISNSELLKNRKNIEELQDIHDLSKLQEKWNLKQNEFNNSFLRERKELYPNTGYYLYTLPVNKISPAGKKKNGYIKLWQIFVSGYSPYFLEEQNDDYKNSYEEVNKLKDCSLSYRKFVYDKLFNIIKNLQEEFSNVLVLFVNSSSNSWPVSTYEGHYKYIKQKFADNSIDYLNFDDFATYKTDEQKTVIIFDFITNNEDMLFKSGLVGSVFMSRNSIMTIGYISIKKQYSHTEIREIINNENPKIES